MMKNLKVQHGGSQSEEIQLRTAVNGGSNYELLLEEAVNAQKFWRFPKEEFKRECVKPTVKHGGGSVMVWGCFTSNGVGKLVFIDGIEKRRVPEHIAD